MTATIETMLPPEATAHLEQLPNEQHRAAFTERLGHLSMIDTTQLDNPLEQRNQFDTTSNEQPPYGQTEQTAQLMTDIARRANQAVKEVTPRTPDEAIESKHVWERILDNQLSDIQEAATRSDKARTEMLLIEHMVSLQLAETGSEYGTSYHEAAQNERAKLSLCRLVGMGLAEEVITASRKAYGLVEVTQTQPDIFDDIRKKDGQEIALRLRIHSVAHTFEPSFAALEVGLGLHPSLDPAEAPFQRTTTKQEDIERLGVIDSAIAATTRFEQIRKTGQTSGFTLIRSLNRHALRSLCEQGFND